MTRANTAIKYLREWRVYTNSDNANDNSVSATGAPKASDRGKALEVCIHNNLASLETAWRELERTSNISIYQRFDWVRACVNTIEREANSHTLIVSVHKNGKLVFLLPLATQNGWIKKVRWIGGSHSNFNIPIVDSEFCRTLKDQDIKHIFGQITQLLPGIGLLKLCCQPKIWAGQKNPLLSYAHQRSTNNAYAIDLSQGFKQVLKKGNAKRKRKKFRWQNRSLESVGGAQLVVANSRSHVLEILSCFHRQKSIRHRNKGLPDVFGSRQANAFLRHMALNSIDVDEPVLQLYALKIAGKYRAICGGGVHNNHFSAYFISFADDEFAHLSPGELLLYLLIEKLADAGFQSMDLGRGEERYKRSWCTQTVEMVDIILPLSALAYGHVWAYRISLGIKRLMRIYPPVWNILKRARICLIRLRNKITGGVS